MALSFGVTVMPDPPYQRIIALIQLARGHGFDHGWTYDSHVRSSLEEWQDRAEGAAYVPRSVDAPTPVAT